MRTLLKIGLIAAGTTILVCADRSLAAAQPASEVELNKNINELIKAGKYSEAIPLAEQVVAIRESRFGHDSVSVANPLNELARLYDNQGRYADAELLYRRALQIWEKDKNDRSVATALNNLAVLYEHQARYSDAETMHLRSLAIKEKLLGSDHPDLAISLNNLASLYQSQGRYTDAEHLYQRSVAILEALSRDDPDFATTLNNLAELYQKQGRYKDAEPLIQRSLKIREKALGRDHPAIAAAIANLAMLYDNQGRYADAEPLYQRSLAIAEKTLGPDHPTVARAVGNLALFYASRGRYSEAEPLFRRKLIIQEKALGRDHPDVASSLRSLAYLYNVQGRHADALPIIRRTISQGTAAPYVTFPVLFASQAKNLTTAPQALRDGYEVVQRSSSSAAANAVSKLAARFAAGSNELAQLVRKDQDLTAEAQNLDKTVIAFVSKASAQRSTEADEKIRKRIAQVKIERENLQRVLNDGFPEYVALSKPQPALLSETQALLADDEALLVFDFAAKSYVWIVTRDGADWTELKISARDLDEQVRSLRAWVVDPRKRFEPALAYRIYQATFGAFADKIAAKQRLSVVTNGALTSLPPQLLLTKDPRGKSLKEMDWLVRSHAVTVLPSVASLKILRSGSQTSSARKPVIAFADPVFSKAARANAQLAMRSITSFYRGTQVDVAAIGEYLPQLPGTRNEAQQVAADLNADANDIKLGLAASETAVKQAKLDQYRIVYFATHGLVAGDLETFAKDRAEPALVLSIPEKPDDLDDGLLTASEIAQLKLDADWAVLSACNTAAEDKPGAEALSGLARAFFYAGARSLIVSHWSVSDEATARLMIGTFRASARNPKLSHAEALRQSMLAMIDAAKSDPEADPRLWAPFVVVGEPAKPQ
jgi:CHAT domain-containing protein